MMTIVENICSTRMLKRSKSSVPGLVALMFTVAKITGCVSSFPPLEEDPSVGETEIIEVPTSGGYTPRIVASKYQFLLGDEARGYGLYSYVLLARSSDARNREFLRRLMSSTGLVVESNIGRGVLNIFYLPVGSRPNNVRDEGEILDVYDFDYTDVLLTKICESSNVRDADVCKSNFSDGPYLVTSASALGEEGLLPNISMFLDLSRINQRAFGEFIDEYQAVVRVRGTNRERLQSFRLRVLNVTLNADDFLDAGVREITQFVRLVEIVVESKSAFEFIRNLFGRAKQDLDVLFAVVGLNSTEEDVEAMPV